MIKSDICKDCEKEEICEKEESDCPFSSENNLNFCQFVPKKSDKNV